MHLLLAISQTTAITFPHVEYSGILPELLLIGGALLCMAISSMVKDEKKTPVFTSIGITIAVVAGAWSYHLYRGVESHGASTLVGGAMALDGFSTFLLVFICIGLVLTLLLGEAFIYRVGAPGPDFVSLLMLSASGAMFMASADDLIVLFLGLEILSISLYVLVAYTARRSASREAAFKYFILGGFSSAIFLYGIALTYGATGSTNIGQIELYLATNTITANGVLLAGLVLLIVGLGFKIAAVPFQLWTPDVYQGAPTTVTGFMAAIAKAAGFAGLLRLLFVPFATLRSDWRPIILVLSLLSLFAGALLALTQRDVKRMLAYSSINHAGFILLGLYVGTQRSVSDSLYYLFAYGIMAIGAFGMVSIVGAIRELPEGTVTLEDLRGLGSTNRRLAVVFAIFLVAQAGAPFTTGFLAKFAVVSAAVRQGDYVVALAAMISAAIAAFFYLRIAVSMFSRGSDTATVDDDEVDVALDTSEVGSQVTVKELVRTDVVPITAALSVGAALVVTVGLGILANPLFQFAYHAVALR